MGRIRLLPDEVASQVAAGEVVERPASVIKELVENSVDARAGRIDVEYQRGGTGFLRVGDDGCGMDREDALLCLERHATSKIRTGGDLARIETMGFRGEALPSIASVSRFRLVTRERGKDAGTEVVVAGGKIESVKDSGDGYGTRIEVRSLFYNLPARRKFLRGERTEAAHIDHQMQTLALANPRLAFSLIKDGRTAFLLAPADGLATRVRDLLGTGAASQLIEMPETDAGGIVFSGMLARSGHARPDRSQQFVFVNGRPIHSTAIWQPLREAYGSSIEKNLHPPVVLFLRIDPALIDCNVHPAKREVRFQEPTRVREAVYEAVRQALDARRTVPIAKPSWKPPDPDDELRPAPLLAGQRPPEPLPVLKVEPQVERVLPVRPSPHEPRPLAMPGSGAEAADDARFRFIGRLAERYLVMEDDSGLVLLDNRAARERILFETLLRQMQGDRGSSQRLLIPAVVDLPPRDFAWVRENAALLASAGLVVEPFGAGTVKIESVPPMLAEWPPEDLLVRMADDCRLAGKQARHRLAEEVVARAISRNAALAGLPTDETAMRRLLAELMRCDLPYACPQGRPTMIHFAFTELDRKFGRTRA
jgi:DNA mismatch repair protein MutL